MKSKLLKKILLGGFTALTMVCMFTTVKADEAKSCVTYKNYYIFNEINDKDTVDDAIESAPEPEKTWIRSHRTFFPLLESDATITASNRVCLSKNGTADGTNCTETMTLEDFYILYSTVESVGTAGNLTTPKGETQYIKYTNSEKMEGKIVSYFMHGNWYEIENSVVGNEGTARVNISSVVADNLVAGSILPENTTISMHFSQNDSAVATIDRTIKPENMTGVTAFILTWGGSERDSVLAPALYYVEYKRCGDYNAIINYYYDGTTDKVEGIDPNPYTETELIDGYTNDITSPIIAGCKADKKTVKIEIDGADFAENVYYTCDKNISEGPTTGDTLIYIALVIGVAAIGFSTYNYIKLRKTQKESI